MLENPFQAEMYRQIWRSLPDCGEQRKVWGESILDLFIGLSVFFVTFLAGLMQTITGFAYAMTSVPLLTMVTGPRDAVLIVLFTGLLMKFVIVYKTWHEVDFAKIFLIFFASFAGSLPGVYLLRWIDDAALKVLISIALLICTAALYFEVRIKIRRHRLAKVVVGIVSGFLGVTTGFNGPPVVLYMMNENEDKNVMRANLASYFTLVNLAAILMMLGPGRVQVDNLWGYALIASPAVFLAWWLGERVFRGLNPITFRCLAMLIIGVSAIVTLASGLWTWMRV